MKIRNIIKSIISPSNLLIHFFFAVYALFAIIYYKERLYGDASYFIFHILNEETFRIEHQRFVQIFFQLLPLAGIKLGLPYKVILVLYSLGNVIYFYLVSMACLHLLKDKAGTFSVIVLLMFGTSYLYFCPIFEIWYGLAIAILFFSMMHRKLYSSRAGLITILAIETLALFSHPLVFILITFLILLNVADEKEFRLRHFLMFAMILIWAVCKPLLMSEYEGGKFDYILDPEKNKSYLNLLSPQYLLSLANLLTEHYKLPIILCALTAFYFWIYDYKKQLLLLSGTFIMYLVFINSTQSAIHLSFYNQRMYLILIPLSTIPFMYYFYSRLYKPFQWLTVLVFSILIWFQFQGIRSFAANYSERVEHTQRLISYTKQFEGDKFIVNENNFRKIYNNPEWSFPVEAILYSALEGPSETTTICTSEDYQFDQNSDKLHSDNFIFRRWDIMKDESLNPKYFKLSSGTYFDLNQPCCIDSIDPFFSSCIDIEVKTLPFYEKNTRSYVRVHINNRNSYPICSNTDEGIYLSYHWYRNSYPYVWDGLRTALEVNVINEYSQDIEVLMPDEAGEYYLVVDIILEYRAWYGINGVSNPVQIY